MFITIIILANILSNSEKARNFNNFINLIKKKFKNISLTAFF